QPAAGLEVRANARKTAQLIHWRQEMLKDAKGSDRDRERRMPQRLSRGHLKVADVRLEQRHASTDLGRFGGQLRAAACEHRSRGVDAGDGVARPGEWKEHATRTAAELQDAPRVSGARRFLYIEAHIGPAGVHGHGIVQRAEVAEVVVAARAHAQCAAKRYRFGTPVLKEPTACCADLPFGMLSDFQFGDAKCRATYAIWPA